MRVIDYKTHVGPGWWPILKELDAQLGDVEVFQVKEKFGELRVYLADQMYTPVQREVIDYARRLSLVTCEMCGKQGMVRGELSWIKTLCDECYPKGGKKWADM